ncbi:MAG: radical SAM family heme chaperone HemW [Silicimonas sp.]|nr:radical SAM family heme chaperone HemW [Silicimonas sp.]
MRPEAGFGLYVHWPFCQAKCPYCDFNSHVTSAVDQSRWSAAFAREIERARTVTGPRVLNSIFFGGGTPSLMEPEVVANVITKARAAWTPANDMEITLEANPTSVEAARFHGYRDAGVNRVSIGIQALNNADLKALGRLHDVSEARAAFDLARNTFDRVSFDLIYARQNQSLDNWRRELSEALSMCADHLSLYQLTIEDGTAFGDRFSRNRLPGLPSDDLSADMFDLTQEMTEAAGLPAYEISNHAVPGGESKHNLIYWRSGDCVGIGPGAHGRLTLNRARVETLSHRKPGPWLSAVERTGSGQCEEEIVTPNESRIESLLMGLRLREGVPADWLAEHTKLPGLVEDGLLEVTSDKIRTTARGRPLLNAILRELLA